MRLCLMDDGNVDGNRNKEIKFKNTIYNFSKKKSLFIAQKKEPKAKQVISYIDKRKR